MRSGQVTRCFLLLAWLAAPAESSAQPGAEAATVEHWLSFPGLRQQYVQVRSRFPAFGDETLLILPSWTPGAYRIRDYAADVDRFEVSDGAGRRFPATKVAKDAWRVRHDGVDRIEVGYRVHAADLNVATSYASPEFVLLNGATVFLYSEASRNLPQVLNVELPDGLGDVMSSLAVSDGRWRARDYDELVDNPVVIADAAVSTFQVDGQDYFLAHIGDAGLWDLEEAWQDVQRIVKSTNDFWGDVPFHRPYWFFNFLVEQGGGLEHDHGTVLMTGRWQMRDRKDYIKWLSLVAHEYFHAWNVRRMRPTALQRYTYRDEQYTPDLWLAEGLTSYYDDLLLARAQVIQPAEYLERLALQFHGLELTPGRLELSLRDASRDAWIRHYQPDANAINSTVSYYVKGAVLGFVLDTRLRSESKGRFSLDDALRRLYRESGQGGYESTQFAAIIEQLAGPGSAGWFEALLEAHEDPDFDAALGWYGLALNRAPGAVDLDKPGRGGLGINWDTETERLVVSAVVNGFSAARAGVLPGDELLAINDERVTRANFEERKRRLREGEWVQLLLSRHGRILRLDLQLGPVRPLHYEIGVVEGFGRRELRRMSDWLGQELAMPR